MSSFKSNTPAFWRKRLFGFYSDNSGSNAAEFALISPIFMLLLFGTILFGWYLGITHSLQEISADTIRYAMVGLDSEERRALAERRISQAIKSYSLIAPGRLSFVEMEEAGAMTVKLSYDVSYMPRLPILGSLVAIPETLERSSSVALP